MAEGEGSDTNGAKINGIVSSSNGKNAPEPKVVITPDMIDALKALLTSLDPNHTPKQTPKDHVVEILKAAKGPEPTTTPARLFSVRVKVDCKESGEVYDAGHEVFMIDSSWDYATLRTGIMQNYQHFQDGTAAKRKNIGLRAYWSKHHDIEEIKAIWHTDNWTNSNDETVICEDNCFQILDMMKCTLAPKLKVTIGLRPFEEKKLEKEKA